MEWTGRQQVCFLIQSVALGCGQGLLLDIISGLVRIVPGRRWLWTDVLFGPLAGLVTFLGAVVIMDGQLHPLLLFGVVGGMVLEHALVGMWVTRGVRIVRRGIGRGVSQTRKWAESERRRLQNCIKFEKNAKKGEKRRCFCKKGLEIFSK